MATKLQIRRDTAANWTAANPVLSAGELGAVTDSNQLKMGNGVTAWATLPYFNVSSGAPDHVLHNKLGVL